MYAYHHQSVVQISASPEEVFAFVDDHIKLSSHMSKRSWMMVGSHMSVDLDELQGKEVGSKIRMTGSILGIEVALDEIVTERCPPKRKVWETIGEPHLIVVGSYRMGVEITPEGNGSELVVFIDYAIPSNGIGRWLGRFFGHYYARWCTNRMAYDACQNYSTQG